MALANIVTVGGMQEGYIRTGEGCAGKEAGEEHSAVGVKAVSSSPVECGGDRAGGG